MSADVGHRLSGHIPNHHMQVIQTDIGRRVHIRPLPICARERPYHRSSGLTDLNHLASEWVVMHHTMGPVMKTTPDRSCEMTPLNFAVVSRSSDVT